MNDTTQLQLIEQLLNNTTPIDQPLEGIALLVQQKLIELNEQVVALQKEVKSLSPQYETPVYKYVNEEILNPPHFVPTKNDIALAKARYVLEEVVWSLIHDLQMYIESLEGKEMKFPYTKEGVAKEAHYELEKWDKAMDKWNDSENLWDALVDEKWFKMAYIDGLSEIHGGDCTAFACSCQRCHAEGMFKIPFTANWGKHEGYRMESQYFADWKEKNPKPAVENK